MKLAIISDIHFGVRNENPTLLQSTINFFEKQFFPYLTKHNIQTVLCAGDIMDRRKYVNYFIYKSVLDHFVAPMKKQHIQFHTILGNHDCFYKNTNEINSLQLIFSNESSWFHVYDHPEILNFGGKKFGMVSWISPENQIEITNFIKSADVDILFAHLELNGFSTAPGIIMSSGMDSSQMNLDRFSLILSGHYHTRQRKGNVQYLGNHHEFSFADYGLEHGFHIYDTETGVLEFIENQDKVFFHITFDDSKFDYKKIVPEELEMYRGKFVKLIVQKSFNPAVLETFIQKVQQAGPEKLTIFDETLPTLSISSCSGDENTMTLLKTYTKESVENEQQREQLDSLLTEIWTEASSDNDNL